MRGTFRTAYHAVLFGAVCTAGIAILGTNPRTGWLVLAATALGIVTARLSHVPGSVWLRIAFTPRRRRPDDDG